MVNPTNAQRVELKQQAVPKVRAEAGRVPVRLELVSVAVPRSGLLRCGKQHPYSTALAASTILGRRIVKVEPRPTSLSTVMSPPII